jgi:cbb3-type cytochrome oxidase maturation protein
MIIVYLMIFGLLITLAVTALYGFYWSAKMGQFENLEDGSQSIFDADEPVGRPTDSFPGETWTPKFRVPTPQKKEVLP